MAADDSGSSAEQADPREGQAQPTAAPARRAEVERHGGGRAAVPAGGHEQARGHEHDHDQGHEHEHEHGGVLASLRELARPHRHEMVRSVDSALESDARGIRAVQVSLVILGITAAIQLGVVLASGSVALLNDTLHNAADALTAVPLWVAFSLGRRRPSARFPYGYGRAEDLAGLVVLAFIVASAAIGLYESVDRLVHPADVRSLLIVGVAGFVGFAGNEAVAQYRIRVGREIGSAALVADGMHARTDGFTSLGVVAGAVGVALGYPIADPIAGLVLALLIVAVLKDAARDVLMRMMDAVDPQIAEGGAQILRDVPGVMDVGSVRTRWIGHRLVADATVTVDRTIDVARAHAIAEDGRHALLHGMPHLSSVIIHADPSSGVADPHAEVAHHD